MATTILEFDEDIPARAICIRGDSVNRHADTMVVLSESAQRQSSGADVQAIATANRQSRQTCERHVAN